MRSHRRWLGWVLFALMALSGREAAAAPTFKEKAEARKLVQEAKKAMKDKRFSDAESALRKADELNPSPQTKLDRARALVEDKSLVEASQVLHVLTDPNATNPKKNFHVVKAAKKLLGEVEPRIPWLRVAVSGPSAAMVEMQIDGKEIDASEEIPIDPGEHEIEVNAEGYESAQKKVELAEGVHEEVKLKLKKIPPPEAPKKKEESGIGAKIPAIVSFGVGAAGLGVGAAFGVMAINQADEVKAQCVNNVCPPSSQGTLDSSKTNGTISTVGFIVGGAGVATGIVLLLIAPSKKKKSEEPKDALTVRPWIGLGSAGVSGRF